MSNISIMGSHSGRRYIALIVVILVVACLMPGCIEIGEEAERVPVGGTPAPAQPSDELYFPPPVQSPVPTPAPPGTGIPAGSAVPADPLNTVSVFSPQSAYVPETSPLPRPNEMPTATFFPASYSQVYINEGLLVSVERAPFVIEFWTRPFTNNPHFSFVTITVRDPLTGEILAEDGYGGKYSSEPYKRMIILGSGNFHVSLSGMRTGLEVRLRGGTDPWAAEPYGTAVIPVVVYEEVYPEEEYWG